MGRIAIDESVFHRTSSLSTREASNASPTAVASSEIQIRRPPSNSRVIVGDSAALAAATRALETASLQSWKDYLTVRYLEQGMAESFGDGVDRDFQVRGSEADGFWQQHNSGRAGGYDEVSVG